LRLVPRIERADVILALDSDFLDCGEGDIASSRAFTSRRRVSAPKDSMNRLYVVENRYTLTGAMADHRMRLPASQIPLIAHAIAMKVATATKDAGLGSVLATLQVPAGAAPIRRTAGWTKRLTIWCRNPVRAWFWPGRNSRGRAVAGLWN
jgi:molybdopterin-containing oxidoreductase family iron-sulfur binding subunit